MTIGELKDKLENIIKENPSARYFPVKGFDRKLNRVADIPDDKIGVVFSVFDSKPYLSFEISSDLDKLLWVYDDPVLPYANEKPEDTFKKIADRISIDIYRDPKIQSIVRYAVNMNDMKMTEAGIDVARDEFNRLANIKLSQGGEWFKWLSRHLTETEILAIKMDVKFPKLNVWLGKEQEAHVWTPESIRLPMK